MIDIKQAIPPTVIAIARLMKTTASLSGWHDRPEFDARNETLARMRAQPIPDASGAPVLVFSFRGWYPHAAWEAVLAHSLRLRGVPAHLFNCGGELPVCEVNFRGASPVVACRECAAYPAAIADQLRIPRSWLREYISDGERRAIVSAVKELRSQDLAEWRWAGQPIGALVRDSVLWFLRKSAIDAVDHDIYKRFLISGAHVATIAPRLIEHVRPRTVLQLNGRFFAERVFNQFVPPSIPVVTYECGWRRDTLGFDRLSSAGSIDLDDAWARWKTRPLTSDENQTLDEWMRSRADGDMQRDFYIKFKTDGSADPLAQLGLSPERKTAVLFTNLVWDTAVLGKDDAFPSIQEWLLGVIKEFGRREQWQLVVRIHPAEDLRPSQPSVERLTDAVLELGMLPSNVRLVGPAERLSSYALMDRCDATLVYTSTAGLESALRGTPVVVGAKVYYKGRGFTVDIPDERSLSSSLNQAMSATLTAGERELARRFAFLLLFRYLKRIPVVQQRPGALPLLVSTEVGQLLPGVSKEFDGLMDAMVAGGPFV